MAGISEPVDDVDLVAEQALLAGSLETLAGKLEKLHHADPVLGLETALAALATIRVWLRVDRVKAAVHIQTVDTELLRRWEYQLAADLQYLSEIAEAVAEESNLSLRDRNRLQG